MTVQSPFTELAKGKAKSSEIPASGEKAGDLSIEQLQTWLDPLLSTAPRQPLRVWHLMVLVVGFSALLWWAILYVGYLLL